MGRRFPPPLYKGDIRSKNISTREPGLLCAHVPLDHPPLHPPLCPIIHLFIKYQIQDKKVMDHGMLGFSSSRIWSTFITSMPGSGSISGRKQSRWYNGNIANSGNQPWRKFGPGLRRGINQGGRGRGEVQTAGGFLPSHIALYSPTSSPSEGPALVCRTPHASGYRCPFVVVSSQSFIVLALTKSWPKTDCKCA